MRSSLNIHNINTIEYSQIKHFEKTVDRKEFYSLDLTIKDSNGNIFEITLFADNQSELVMTKE